MKINFNAKNLSIQNKDQSFTRLLADVMQELSKEYNVKPNAAYTYFLSDEGSQVFTQHLNEKFNLDAKYWCWKIGDEVIGQGFDIPENPELTKFMLERTSIN